MAFRWAVVLVVFVVSTEVVVEGCWTLAGLTREEVKGPCTLEAEAINEMLNGPHFIADLYPPDCDADGYFSAKQCDVAHGYCRCVDKEGNPIGNYNGFITDVHMGQVGTWADSTCACAREEHELASQTPVPGMFTPRCDWKGDYDRIQCQGSMCYCVDDNLQQVGQSVYMWQQHSLNCDGHGRPTQRPTHPPRPPTLPPRPGCEYGGQFYPPGTTIYETTGCMGSGARCDDNGQVLVWDNFGFGCCEHNGQYYEDGVTITDGGLTCSCVGSDNPAPAPMTCTGPPTTVPIPPTLPPIGAGDCSSSPCLNDANCWDAGMESGYMCECRLGYGGSRCENYSDPCQAGNNPCQNNGTCLYDSWDGNTYPYCQCPPGFTGMMCETLFPETCDDTSCQNGGTCTSMPCGGPDCPDDSWCTCAAGFTGYTCEFLFGICDVSSCLNSGVCEQVPFESYYSCNCPAGTSGIRCETMGYIPPTLPPTDAGNCSSSPCLNDANCWDAGLDSGYMCECRLGYGGSRCENYSDPCQAGNNPCQNNGTCLYDSWDGNTYPYCQCPPGFTGMMCETLFPETCDDTSCQNGGTCTSMPCDGPGCPDDSWCTCAAGFTGYTCEFLFGICDVSSCLNSGVCEQVPFESYYSCNCPAGTSGIRCETVG